MNKVAVIVSKKRNIAIVIDVDQTTQYDNYTKIVKGNITVHEFDVAEKCTTRLPARRAYAYSEWCTYMPTFYHNSSAHRRFKIMAAPSVQPHPTLSNDMRKVLFLCGLRFDETTKRWSAPAGTQIIRIVQQRFLIVKYLNKCASALGMEHYDDEKLYMVRDPLPAIGKHLYSHPASEVCNDMINKINEIMQKICVNMRLRCDDDGADILLIDA